MSSFRLPVILLVMLTWTVDVIQGHICNGSDNSVRTWEINEPIIEGQTLYEGNFTDVTLIEGGDYMQVVNGTFTSKRNLSLDGDQSLCSNSDKEFKLDCDIFGELTGRLFIQKVNNFSPKFPNKTFVRKIREGMPPNFVVMDVEADNKPVNKDCGESVHILGTNTSDLFFDAKNTLVKTGRIFDYEMGDRELNITLTALDDGSPPRNDTFVFILQIEDIDDMDPAFRDDSYTLHVTEGTPVSDDWVPAKPPIEAFDQDLGINASIAYSIPDQTFAHPDPIMAMNVSNGMLRHNGTLDRETVDTYHIIIKATEEDESQRAVTSTLTLIVDDINDNRPLFDPVTYNVTIQEHTASYVNIARVSATDADSGNNSVFSYGLTSGSELFTIDPHTGYIRVGNSSALDRETEDMYTITVNATEQEEPVGSSCHASCTATVTVKLQDINDHAPEFQNESYTFSVLNISVGNFIGQVTATDRDIGDNGRVEYSIADDTAFSINQSGVITLKKAAISDQTFLISACDFGLNRLCGTAQVTVKIPLHSVQSTNVTVNVTENVAVDTPVYVLTPEYEGYVLELQPESGPFTLHDDPNRIVTSDVIDRETRSQYALPINVILQNKTHAVLTIDVHVLDENDNAPIFNKSSYSFNVADDAKEGDDVGQVTAHDLDDGVNGEVSYLIQGHLSSQDFNVDRTSGQITLKSVPDLAREFTEVVIVATDNGTPNRKNTTAVKVYVGQVPGKVRFFVPAGSDEVKTDEAELISGMSEILRLTVAFDDVRPVTSPYGPSCAIYLTATHPAKRAATTTGAVEEDVLRSRVEENYEDLLHLFAKYQRSTSPKDDDPFTLPVIILIAVAAALLLASLLVTALLCRRSNRYKRQIRLASVLNRGSTIYDTQEVKVDVEDEESIHSLSGSLSSRLLLNSNQPNGTAIGVVNSAYDNSGETHDTETQYTHVEDEDETQVKEEVIVDVDGENNPEQETGEVTPNPDYVNASVKADDITTTIEPSPLSSVVEPDYINAEILEDNVQTTEATEILDAVEPDYNDTDAADNHGDEPQTMEAKDNVEDVYAVVNKTRPENIPPPPPLPQEKEEKTKDGDGEEEEEEEEDLPPPPPTPPRVRKSDTAEEEEVESDPEDEPEPDYAKKVRFSEVKVTVIPEKEDKVKTEDDVVDGSDTEPEEDTKRDRPFETIENPADNLSDDGPFFMTSL